MAMIFCHGMLGVRDRVSSAIRAAASPRISMSLTNAKTNWRSVSRSLRTRPDANEAASRAAQACDASESRHPSAYCNSAVASTSCLKYGLRSSSVRRSTLRPRNNLDNSNSMPASPSSPGMRSALNSMSTSISLFGPNSSRSAEPKIASRRIPFASQKDESSVFSTDTCAFIAARHSSRDTSILVHVVLFVHCQATGIEPGRSGGNRSPRR